MYIYIHVCVCRDISLQVRAGLDKILSCFAKEEDEGRCGAGGALHVELCLVHAALLPVLGLVAFS